jgi:succinate dehydrogenase/fumarate reductase flavoprotein subunit
MNIRSSQKLINTDVLVVGAGMAGFFAAIKAKEYGVDVTLVDKAYAGKSGSTHFSEGDIVFFRPERGHKIEEWLEVISTNCEYLNNREWNEICLKESKDRFDDLVSWGIPFHQKDGELYVFSGIGTGPHTTYEDVSMVNRTYAPLLRRKALESGVRVLDNVMIGELLKQDGKVAGAVGFHIRSGNLYVIKAGAIVLATGSLNLKSGSYPVQFWSGDGEAMAYRAGAEVSGAEFTFVVTPKRDEVRRARQREEAGTADICGEIRDESYRFPFAIGGNWTGWYSSPRLNSEGRFSVFPPWEAHCGHAPLYHDFDSYGEAQWQWMRDFLSRLGTHQGDKIGLDPMQGGKLKWPASRVMSYSIHGGAAGIWPVDKNCASGVPGLYAAGNTCATMGSGAGYAGMGWASNHAAVTGSRAGLAAAAFAMDRKEKTIDQTEIARATASVCGPVERAGGFSPAWVTQVLHGFTVPYFILGVKQEERLQAALTFVEFVKTHLVPKLKANDSHEWRLAHETKNIVLVAEMKLRASLFRTESRGSHFREDYPRRDDPNWLSWIKLRDTEGKMFAYKEPIPEKWWPDLSKPYEERYPRVLPQEE